MGEIYLAEDTVLHRKVALKLLPADLVQHRERLGRFKQEALTASALNHPNILTVYEIGEAEQSRFIAAEYVDGKTLRQYLKDSHLSLREALDVASQVASALAAAHKVGIVHRDIKPENIMIRRDDSIVKVLDFGLAKATEKSAPQGDELEAPTRALVHTDPGVVMGTASYMSPEQARGLPVDERSDIWSLGVVLYEMLAGRPPFEGPTSSDVIALILHKEPLALTRLSDEATERLDEIVTKALAKDREERYQVAKDLLIDLKRLKQHLDFESEVERTFAPEPRSRTETHSIVDTNAQSASQSLTQSATASTRASSAQYIVSEIKSHKKGFGAIAAGLVLAVFAAGFYFWKSSSNARTLNDKDTIVLADFLNTTGDSVFDGTLKQALAVHLGQSPFLNIFGDERVREVLRFMGRSPDERVTKDVAREICQRQGLKALLSGSVSSLGNNYVITLEAINAQTGDVIAREQAETSGKEQVLTTLGRLASQLRQELGESLASIQKFDAPLQQATTSSLEALKALSLGDELRGSGNYEDAIPYFKRAIELDPNFALAYARLGVVYFNTRRPELAAQYSEKAFDLRDRVSERERLYIESRYHWDVLGDLDKTIEVLGLWKRTYPRDFVPYNNLSVQYHLTGQWEESIKEAREAMRLNPNNSTPYTNLAQGFASLNRLDEAKAVIEQALSQKLDSFTNRGVLYIIAYVQGDRAAMDQQVVWAKGKPNEYLMIANQASSAADSGQSRKSRDFTARAVDLARHHQANELAASYTAQTALTAAALRDCKQVKNDVGKALELARSKNSLARSALALALCGEDTSPQPLIDELTRRYPKDTLIVGVWLPVIRAAIEIGRGGNSEQAIRSLQATERFEMTSNGPWAHYLRGQAYLRRRAGAEASVEFRKILQRRTVLFFPVNTYSPLYPLAQLGLARAAALSGDIAASRKSYQDFFALWKDADQDIVVLQEARREYEKLK